MTTNHVCMLAPDLVPVWSGIATYVIGLLENAPQDIDLHVITTRRSIPGVDGTRELNAFLNKLKGNIKIYPICNSTQTLFDHARFQVACLKAVPELHRKLGFDILHVNFPLMSEVLLTLTRRVRIPIVSTIHTTIEGQHKGVSGAGEQLSTMGQTDLANMFLGLPLKVAELICLKNYSKLIATSYFVEKELTSFFPLMARFDRTVIHNGINVDFFRPTDELASGKLADLQSIDRPIILYTGRFVASKGIYTLIRAIPMVLERHPTALFVFTGGGDYSPYFNMLGSKVQAENCLFLGYLPREEMPKLYSIATVYAMPTLYESFPLRLLESMACERAVVASEICGIPEVIESGKNGFLVPAQDSLSMAKAINVLLDRKDLLKQIGKKARKTILERFSAEVMTRRTMEVYQSIQD